MCRSNFLEHMKKVTLAIIMNASRVSETTCCLSHFFAFTYSQVLFFVELIGVGATRGDVLWQSIRILIKIVTALATRIYGLGIPP